MTKTAKDIKSQAHDMIDRLPDDVSWEEAIARLETWVDIVAGEEDIDAGRFETNEEVRRRYGFEP